MSNTRVYVGRINYRTGRRELEDVFGRYGRLVSVDVKNGFAFAEYENSRDAEDALREDGRELDGSRIMVQMAKGERRAPSEGRGGRGPPQRSQNRCIIENLPRNMSWQDVKDYVRRVAEVLYADVFPVGGAAEAVVEFATHDDMRRAIRELDGADLDGGRIRIFQDRPRRSPSPRRRSPRRYGSRSPRRSPPRGRRSPSPRRRTPPRGGSPRRSPPRGSPPRGSPPRGSPPRGSPPRGSPPRRSPPRGDRSPSPRRSPSPARGRSPSPRRSPSPVSRKRTRSPGAEESDAKRQRTE